MALTKIVDFIVRAKATGTKEVQSEVNTMVTSIEDGGARVDKILRGQAKLTRRLAAQNKKAFTLAAVGVGPLIRAYANVAASLFALEGVWDSVNIGAKFLQTSEAFDSLAAGFDANSKLLIADLKDLAAGSLTTQQIMQEAALGLSSGLSTKQLEELTLVARKAAHAMGRTMPDAYSRLIKGVTKLEPELLDELGITTKLGPALREYAKATGQAVQDVTQLEKTQLFANNAIEEGNKKFKDVDVTTKSYSERLQSLKTNLIDYATEMSAKAIPALTTLFETIASLSSEIVFLVSSFAAYKAITLAQAAATRKLSSEQGLLASLERRRIETNAELAASTIALAEAEAAEATAQRALASGTTNLTAAEAALTKAKLEQAKLRQSELLTQKETIAANLAEAESTTLLATAKRGLTRATGLLSKALGFLSRAFLPVFIIMQILEATGLLSKAWELLAGKHIPTLQEKMDSLTTTQREVAVTMEEMGIKAQDSVDGILAGDIALSNFGDTAQIVASKADGTVKVLTVLGKTKIFDEQNNQALANMINKLNNYKNVLTDLIAKQKEAEQNKGSFWNIITGGPDAAQAGAAVAEMEKKIAALEAQIAKLKEAAVKAAQEPFSFVSKGNESAATFKQKLADGGIKDVVDMSQSKQDKARAKVQALESINVTKQLAEQTQVLAEAKARLAAEEAKGENANKINIKAAKDFIKVTEDNIKQLKAIPGALSVAREALKKATHTKASDKGLLDSEKVAAEIRALKAKKSEQTKDVESTVAYFSKLAELEQRQFDLSFARKKADLANSDKTAQEKAAILYKIQSKHTEEMLRLQKETDSIIVENQKANLKAIFENENNSFKDRMAAQAAYDELVISQVKGSQEKINNITESKAAARQDSIDKHLAKTGGFFDSLVAKAKLAAKDMQSVGSMMSDAFLKASNIIKDALTNKIITSLGLVTDEAKKQFQEQLQAAQTAFQGMVQAANEAFGSSVADGKTKADRALQDLQLKRERQISDLTAKRDKGLITQSEFDAGLQKINTDFNRGKQDIGITQGRGVEDAQKKRSKSLLDAQKQLNAELLKANKAYAKENNKVWDSMYASLKKTAFSFLGDLLAAEAKKAAISLANKAAEAAAELGIGAAQATGEVATTGAKDMAQGTMDIATVLPRIMQQIGLPGLVIGGVIVAGLTAALVSAISKSSKPISAPAAPTASFTPKATFHTGGMITGSGQSEVPFIGLTGEGVLNRHNGMKAVGGPSGLATANATGVLPQQTTGSTSVTIQLTTQDGQVKDSLTIDNFEEFLRSKGAKQMHSVSRDGYIMMDSQAITGL